MRSEPGPNVVEWYLSSRRRTRGRRRGGRGRRTRRRREEGKGKGQDTCYSATYISQTRDRQRFLQCRKWQPMVPQRIMWPSIARTNGQLDPRCS